MTAQQTPECSTSISLETKAFAIPAEKSSAKHCSLELNAEANEFVLRKTRFPELVSFGHVDGVSDGTATVREKTAVDAGRVQDHPAGLNARGNEFVPPSRGASGGTVAVPSGSDKSERSLNVFAREFVPSNFQSNAAVHPSNVPAMAPVYRPASPRPPPEFRPRDQAVIQRRLPSGRFLPIHPRVRPRFHGAQQVMRRAGQQLTDNSR